MWGLFFSVYMCVFDHFFFFALSFCLVLIFNSFFALWIRLCSLHTLILWNFVWFSRNQLILYTASYHSMSAIPINGNSSNESGECTNTVHTEINTTTSTGELKEKCNLITIFFLQTKHFTQGDG